MFALFPVVMSLLLHLSSAKSASPYQKNKSDTYEQNPMYQDKSTTNFYNLLFSSRNREEQEVKGEIAKVIVTTESSTTTLSPNDVNFPHDMRSGQAEAKYIKISSSIEIPETESVKLVIDALKVLWDASLTSMWKGFMPSMERVRRDTSALESTKGTKSLVTQPLNFCRILFTQVLSSTGLWTSLVP